MASIFEINTYMQLVDEPLARQLWLLEGLADHDLARTLVRNPEHDATAAMVGHGTGVLDERVEFEGVLRLLELDILAFLGVQQIGHGHLSSMDYLLCC